MGEIAPPPPPRPLAGLPVHEQLAAVTQDYVDALAWGAELRETREALIRWIERVRLHHLKDTDDGRTE